MFGSKIRSWMENHIVRPRKRCNKNKHNSSNNPNETTKTDVFPSHPLINEHQKTPALEVVSSSHASSSNSISNHHYGNSLGNNTASPARRREVSPIQNHSRYGWQSPDSENITSPKSDNFLYAPQHHHHHRVKHHHIKQNSSEANQKDVVAPTKGGLQILHNNKQSRKQQLKQQQQQEVNQQSLENTSSSFSSLSWSTGSKEQNSNNTKELNGIEKVSVTNAEQHQNFLQIPTTTSTLLNPNSSKNNFDDNPDIVHYEEIQTAVLRHPENINSMNIFSEPERPKSEQFISSMRHDYDSPAARYGKLLPSRIRPNSSGSNDRLNANPSIYVIGSAESLSYNNSNREIGASNGNPFSAHCYNRFRTAGNAPPFHGLSSPESAYSTGYSTDGTSPGTVQTHPPEYYINMRTGTHYFPKSINSLAIEAQRCRFGLNKIEEMSPIDPLPKASFSSSLDKMSKPQFYVYPDTNMEVVTTDSTQHTINIDSHSPITQCNAIKLPILSGFENSSPRQRCRIRTNPWYSTNENISPLFPLSKFGAPIVPSSTNCNSSISMQKQVESPKRMTIVAMVSNDSKSNGPERTRKNNEQMLNITMRTSYESYSSEDSSDGSKHSTSSLTEVECANEVRSSNSFARNKLHIKENTSALRPTFSGTVAPIAYSEDEDATLNEMMGKFDESYIYEKETDILSDSDATNCPSELDTGLDAGDECDTEELLDIDFIDTSSMHESTDKQAAIRCFQKCQTISNSLENISKPNVGIKLNPQTPNRQAENKKSLGSSSQRKRKRFKKTRKKSCSEQKENCSANKMLLHPRKSRETRSVGGTPISLRRNTGHAKRRDSQTMTAMTTRASSLVFSHKQEPRYLTIAESSKALLKADLEADVKYRQLIQEAESILVTLKNSNQSIPRETPVSSPRRINPLLNKRVEMLKSCEVRSSQPTANHHHQQHQLQRPLDSEQDMNVALHKRIEFLKYKTSSAPNSPKSAPRFSPSKTHITNFINQMDGLRKTNGLSSSNDQQRVVRTSQVNDYHRQSLSNVTSSQKQSLRIDSLTNINKNQPINQEFDKLSNFYVASPTSEHRMDLANHNCLPEKSQIFPDDYKNHNMKIDESRLYNNNVTQVKTRNNRQYCPQSEPLKRKVYKTSSTFDRIKRGLALEAEYAKEDFLCNTQNLQMSHTNSSMNLNLLLNKSSSQDLNPINNHNHNFIINKKQLILDTLSDLKQNLENQSVELNGLNAN